jgi:hypothetical protein
MVSSARQKMLCGLTDLNVFLPSLSYTSVVCAVGSSVTMSLTEFSFQNLVYWNLFEVLVAEIT